MLVNCQPSINCWSSTLLATTSSSIFPFSMSPFVRALMSSCLPIAGRSLAGIWFNSLRLKWCTIPAPNESPRTLITVRNRSLTQQGTVAKNHKQSQFINLYNNSLKLRQCTYKNQSTAIMSETSSAGKPSVSSTITMVTTPACGIPAAPILAAVAVILHRRVYKAIYFIFQKKRSFYVW